MRNRLFMFLALASVAGGCGNIEVKGGASDASTDASACSPRCIGEQPIGCDSEGNEVLGQECTSGTSCSQGVCIPNTSPEPDATDASTGGDTPLPDATTGEDTPSADTTNDGGNPSPDTTGGQDTGPDASTGDAAGDASCTPQCDGKQCGPDGCGGTCGTCLEEGQSCDNDGQCTCTPDVTTICQDGDVYFQDSCGTTGALSATCDFGCSDGSCDGCTPNCDGKQCGPDGCGSTCGTCQVNGQSCNNDGQCACTPDVTTICQDGNVYFQDSCGTTGALSATCDFGCSDGSCDGCTPNCDGKQCGDNGCGGTCGTCAGAQDLCVVDQCICQPDCAGDCGPDGCGGSCGTCGAGETCADTNNNNVVDTCQCDPVCAAGQECGLDSCGGNTCGACDAGTVCAANNTCVECVTTDDCGEGLVCDTDNNACVECMTDGDCGSSNSLGNSCFDNLCVVRYELETDADFPDSNPGDGQCFGIGPTSDGCSLRAAIMESNSDGARNLIQLAAEKTFPIDAVTDPGNDENPELGDFELYAEEKITSGPHIIFTSDSDNAHAIIDGEANHRVFQVVSGVHQFRWIHVTQGRAKGWGGGAFKIDSAASVELRNCWLTQNRDNANGQTVFINGGNLRAYDTWFFDNGTPPVAGEPLQSGQSANGGAIFMSGGTLEVDRCAFFQNVAGFRGSAISGGFGILVRNSVFYNNALTNTGSEGGTINSTSGTYLYNTLWKNQDLPGQHQSAGLFSKGNSTLRGTIIAENLSGSVEQNCAGIFTSEGHNFISANCGISPATGDQFGELGSSKTPMLSEASDGRVIPMPSSPVIDAAEDPKCPSTDQFLVLRPQGPACDIGSVEAF